MLSPNETHPPIPESMPPQMPVELAVPPPAFRLAPRRTRLRLCDPGCRIRLSDDLELLRTHVRLVLQDGQWRAGGDSSLAAQE